MPHLDHLGHQIGDGDQFGGRIAPGDHHMLIAGPAPQGLDDLRQVKPAPGEHMVELIQQIQVVASGSQIGTHLRPAGDGQLSLVGAPPGPGSGAPRPQGLPLDRAAEADEVLSRAVYRIVQESLTNARKHSPGMSVQLRVEGGPNTGIDITCSNQLPYRMSATEQDGQDAEASEAPHSGDARPEPGSATGARPGDTQGGSGLKGMARRAEICGGTFQAGPDGRGRFVVSAHLPWRSADSRQTGH